MAAMAVAMVEAAWVVAVMAGVMAGATKGEVTVAEMGVAMEVEWAAEMGAVAVAKVAVVKAGAVMAVEMVVETATAEDQAAESAVRAVGAVVAETGLEEAGRGMAGMAAARGSVAVAKHRPSEQYRATHAAGC